MKDKNLLFLPMLALFFALPGIAHVTGKQVVDEYRSAMANFLEIKLTHPENEHYLFGKMTRDAVDDLQAAEIESQCSDLDRAAIRDFLGLVGSPALKSREPDQAPGDYSSITSSLILLFSQMSFKGRVYYTGSPSLKCAGLFAKPRQYKVVSELYEKFVQGNLKKYFYPIDYWVSLEK